MGNCPGQEMEKQTEPHFYKIGTRSKHFSSNQTHPRQFSSSSSLQSPFLGFSPNRFTHRTDFTETECPQENNQGWKKNPSGRFPEFGVIFKSNKSTKQECLKRKIFGLPLSQVNFVQKVQVGMVLFLFEHEQRKLYGVFEAISEGGLNIVPNAYSSSGKQFSAQVRICTIWSCHPLSEPEFRGAIEDNYYTDYKFNFGLSRAQVSNLLWLFESKKVRIQKSLNQSAESKVAKRHCMSSGKGLEKGRSSAGESSREKLHTEIVSESIIVTGDTKVSQSSLNSSANSDHAIQEREDSGADSEHKMSSNILTPSFQNSSGLGSSLGTSIHEAIAQFLSSFRSQLISSCDEPKTFDVSSSSITTDLGDYIPLSSPDHCDSTDAVDNVYDPVAPIISERIPSHEDVESSTVVVPPSNMDDRCMNVGSSCLESQSIGSAEQSDSDYNVVYPTAKGLYSDIPKEKTSVFSHLTSASKPIVQKKNSFTSADKTVQEIMDKLQQRHNNRRKKTTKEAMSTRDGNEDNAMKKRTSVFSRLKLDLKANASQNKDNIKEDKSVDNMSTSGNKTMSGPNSYIRKYDHDGNFNRSPQQSEMIKHASPTDEQDLQDAWGSRRISNDSPRLNFEPRNEMLNEQSVTNGRGCTESFDSESSFEKQCKKRKLVEQNSSDFNGGNCLNVQMTSQESSSGKENDGRVGIDEKNHISHEDLPLSMRSPVRILEQESKQHFDK